MRPKIKIRCKYCGKKVYKLKHHILYNKKHKLKSFCSRGCVNLSKLTGKFVNCNTCGKKVWRTPVGLKASKSGNYYCSKRCATITNNAIYKSGKNHPNWKAGSGSYRTRALKHYGHKCLLCAYDNELIVEVHHKDSNRKNNKLKNLVVLCPTHHREITFGIRKLK